MPLNTVNGNVMFSEKLKYLSQFPKIGRYVSSLPILPGTSIYFFEHWTATAPFVEEKFKELYEADLKLVKTRV